MLARNSLEHGLQACTARHLFPISKARWHGPLALAPRKNSAQQGDGHICQLVYDLGPQGFFKRRIRPGYLAVKPS